jgi:hypothetical protein
MNTLIERAKQIEKRQSETLQEFYKENKIFHEIHFNNNIAFTIR